MDDEVHALTRDAKACGPVRRSKSGPKRALVLGAVHVVILAHVTHWLIRGKTLSPVEPSESMATLELGQVNAGAIFFALAILSTAIFGRFFCGWGCHVVALQDLCAWLLKKMGVKPRPFRSRLLLWVPALLAFSMFAWPTLKRVVVQPALAAVLPGAAVAFATPAFPGFTNHLETEHFWATFPGVMVAVPFLLVCGFAVVLFLGSKGFCTYGCPYGGIFVPVDRFAPGRIRVSDACNGCGHCTTVCTSNVRVHEEVRDFKMVVDPGCMKCMDCVSVCPNDALSFGFKGPSRAEALKTAGANAIRKLKEKAAGGKGATGARPAGRRWDLTWPEEIGVAANFGFALFAFRGLYDVFPLLFAVGIALCVTFLAWTSWRMTRVPDVAIQRMRLKSGGQRTPAGAVVLLATALVAVVTLHSAAVQFARKAGDRLDRRVTPANEEIFAGQVAEPGSALRRDAEAAAVWYRRADTRSAGGWGLGEVGTIPMRRAWLALVTGDRAGAETQLRRVLVRRPNEVGARDGLARVLLLDGRADEAIYEWEEAIRVQPTNAALHRSLADAYVSSGRTSDAIDELVIATNLAPEDAAAHAALARLREGAARERIDAERRARENRDDHDHE